MGVVGVVVEPVGPVSGLVTATPLHQEVRWYAPSQLKEKWMWSVCGETP